MISVTLSDISTSGLGDHITISGCRSSSKLFLEINMVDSFRFRVEKNQFVFFSK